MSLNLPLVIREYVLKMLNEASVGMKALILDDYTVGIKKKYKKIERRVFCFFCAIQPILTYLP